MNITNNDEGCLAQSDGSSTPLQFLERTQPLFKIDKSVQELRARLSSYGLEKTQDADRVLRELEGIILLCVSLSNTRNLQSGVASVMLYARSWLDTSILSYIEKFVNDMSGEFTPQAGSCGSGDIDADWMSFVKNIRYNWQSIRHNKFFKHFTNLLSLCVMSGLCNVSSVTFKYDEFVLVSPNLELINSRAIDIVDVFFDTCIFFFETFATCIKHKSLHPLIFGDPNLVSLDETIAEISTFWKFELAGVSTASLRISNSNFLGELLNCENRIRSLLIEASQFDKKLLNDKLVALAKLRFEFTSVTLSKSLKTAPFVLEFFGDSNQGKTTVATQLTNVLMAAQDLPCGDEYRCKYDPVDNFMSQWSSDKLVMMVDDIANEKAATNPGNSPVRFLVELCNNTPMCANKAELEGKGKVFVNPELVLVTTNVKDLDAYTYSNCPYSIQRRMNYIITVKSKAEFLDDYGGLDPVAVQDFKSDANYVPSPIDDIWILTVEKCVKPAKINHLGTYVPVVHRGKKLQDVSAAEVANFLCVEFDKHRRSQAYLLDCHTHRTPLEKCSELCPHVRGLCPYHKFEEQHGEILASGLTQLFKQSSRVFDAGISSSEAAITTSMLYCARWFFKYKFDIVPCLPSSWLNHPFTQWLACSLYHVHMIRCYVVLSLVIWSSSFYLVYVVRVTPWCLTLPAFMQYYMHDFIFSVLMLKLRSRNTIRPSLLVLRDQYAGFALKMAALLAFLKVLKCLSDQLRVEPQGNLQPTSPMDVAVRDSQENPWSSVVTRKLPSRNPNTTSAQLILKVQKNLVCCQYEHLGAQFQVNGLFLCSNLILLPSHILTKNEMRMRCLKVNPNDCGGNFEVVISECTTYIPPFSDYAFCYVSSGGSYSDLRRFICDEPPLSCEFTLIKRQLDGTIESDTFGNPVIGVAKYTKTSNGVKDFMGYNYALNINTYRGLCGGVLVSRNSPVILGLHLGGSTGTVHGCSCALTKRMLDRAYSILYAREGVLLTGASEHFECQAFGRRLYTESPPHYKSPVHYMPNGSQITHYGITQETVKFKTSVRKTIISDSVVDVMNFPFIYKSPCVRPRYKPWQDCLSELSLPGSSLPINLMELAIIDYKEDLLPIFELKLWSSSRPLTTRENICGIPGVKFIDAIKSNTSIGYPLNCAKDKYMINLEPDGTYQHPRTFTSEVFQEISRCESLYRCGERAYPIAKAALKDEVVTKDKCRVFYVNPISLTFLLRKYFLPILRVVQMNPLISECAVGINCHSEEWDQFYKHAVFFGEDRLLGGDYSKYDQKLPSQLLCASFRILIDCAKRCNYSPQDILVMEAMAGDVIYSCISYNGDLISLSEGGHISGNSLTVILNSICGSLNLRCAFYHYNFPLSSATRMKFREHVKLMTYGDDNIGSVISTCTNFNIVTISKFLKRYGQIYTMPNKDSDLTEFLPLSEFEFLKRKSVYHEQLGAYLGALSESSCAKMLHAHLWDSTSPLTQEMAAAQNIDSAAREWFNHGETIYEMRRAQLCVISVRHGLQSLCTELSKSYSDRAQEWHVKYSSGAGDTKNSLADKAPHT